MSNNAVQSTQPRAWLWQPNLIVFVSSACIMVLELVAGRIIAPHVGSSLYTWTTVIGVVLAGIMLGNYLGGRIADRWASLRLLGAIYLVAAFASIAILGIDRMNRLTPNEWNIVVEILIFTTAMFFVPCTILGTLSPIVAKLAVSDLSKTGSTVGKIYAAGALGSIVGTFATGFILISWFGTYTIVLGVALILLAMGLMFTLRVGARGWSVAAAVLAVAGGAWYASNQGWNKGPCAVETNYYCIKTYDEERDGETIRMFVLDHLVHSYVALNNPNKLIYPYEQAYAEIAQMRASRGASPSLLMIGGGGYTFPRFMEMTYPKSDIQVAEIDPGVTQAAHDLLALKRDTKIVTHNQDARMFMAGKPTQKFDLIFGDAFNHYSVPYHLTTKEFNERVRAWLADDGLYVVNIIDGRHGDFTRAYFHTLRQTFKYVYLGEGNGDWRNTARNFFLLIASDAPLDLNALAQFDGGDGDALTARLIANDAEIKRLLTEAPLITLTDQFAPVDQMLASTFTE